MNKRIVFVIVMLLAALLTGCVGTPVVYYTECDCPDGAHDMAAVPETEAAEATATEPVEGALKTGLAVVTDVSGSESGVKAAYDVTVVAVLVDDEGVIRDLYIDSVGANVEFDATGAITSDINAAVSTKRELGDNYGMVAYAGAKYEWYQQVDALEEYAIGKTVDELKNGAVDESGYAPEDSDLASSATIALGGYVGAVETAVNNAEHRGAQGGDELKVAVISGVGSSKAAADGQDGVAQLDCGVAAITVKDGVITSCIIDSVQAKVSFDASGAITSDISAPVLTKGELGENYGMVAWGGAKFEWNEQAAAFCDYAVGKNADEIAGIAVSEGKPTDADLAASVTISISDFQDLIKKAFE